MSEDRLNKEQEVPSLAEFLTWDAEQLRPLLLNKSLIFSPGGSSRWYFLEHGDAQVGYYDKAIFQEYTRLTLNRILEIAHMMFIDGIKTILVFGLPPKQSIRIEAYKQLFGEGIRVLFNDATKKLYKNYDIAVSFRGPWSLVMQEAGISELFEASQSLENETLGRNNKLIWSTEDDAIPASVIPFLVDYYAKTGQIPDTASLCNIYYGHSFSHVDIFISNNKPNLQGQIPPLLTVGDVYFTISPSLYMDKQQWRSILYDHLFARKKTYRKYTAMSPETIDEMRLFYRVNKGATLGVGSFHEASQTWRPLLPNTMQD